MNQELLIGSAMLVICTLFLGAAGVLFVRYQKNGNRPAYLEKTANVRFSGEFLEEMQEFYRISGSVEGMLVLSGEQCRDIKIARKMAAAVSYLKESRYRDFETALFRYAWDGTEETKKLFEQILETEIRKKRALPDRNRRN